MNDNARVGLQEDEDVQRKRLLMQYTKFKSLASNLQKFSHELEEGTTEAAQKNLVQLVKELLSMSLWARKLDATKSANLQDQGNYKRRKVEQEARIVQAHHDINEQKELLAKARIERQNNEEYEKLRHQVMQYAARSTTLNNCRQLESDILGLEDESLKLDLAAERQRKQFAVLIHCLEDAKFGEPDQDEGRVTAPSDKRTEEIEV